MDDRKIRALLDRRTRLQAKVRGLDEAIERWQRAQLRATGLSPRKARGTVNEMFPDAVRLAFSAGKAERNEDTKRFILAANAKHMTMGQVSRAAKSAINDERGASISTISQALQGSKAIRRRVAKAIAAIIDYPATARNWPGGILDDDE